MRADTWESQQDIRIWMSTRHYFYVFLRPVELSLFRKVQNRFEPPVADFGCGDGFFASNLAPPGTFAFGIDNNPRVVKAAQNVYKSVVVADNSSIDLPSESIGTIISNSVFEHLHHPHDTLGELHRILQPGGRLYATVTLSDWENCFYGNRLPGNAYRRFMRFVQRHVSLFDADAWQTIFNDAGFRVVRKTGYLNVATVRLIEKYHYLCLPSLAAGILPQNVRNRFVQRLNRLFSRMNPPPDSSENMESDKSSLFPEVHLSGSIQNDRQTGTIASPCCFFELKKIKENVLVNNRNASVKPVAGYARRKMKILFVSSYFLPYTSGAITSPAEILRHFVSQGHTVNVLTFKHDSSLPDTDEYDGIRVRRFPYELRINKGFLSFLYPFRTMREFRRADVVIFNQPVFEGLFVIGTARLAGKKIISLVNCQVTLGSGLKNRMLTAVLNMSMSIQLELSNTIVTNTKDYAEHTPLLRRYGYKTRYIPPLVSLQPASASFKTLLENKKRNDIWVAFCGRISSEKGLEHLVRSFTYLEKLRSRDAPKNCPHDVQDASSRSGCSGADVLESENCSVSSVKGRGIVLVFAGPYGRDVVGEASYYEKIRQLCVTLNVPHEFTGYLSLQELSAFYDVMDCLVLPSVNGTESFGIVQVEAMQHGKPVIASNLPGVRIPIESTGMGLVSNPGDPEDIARCIHSVLNDSSFTAPENRCKIDLLMDTGHICDAWDACILPDERGDRP